LSSVAAKLHIVVVKLSSIIGRGRFPDHVLTVNNELRRPDEEEAEGWCHVPKDGDGRKDTVKIGRSEAWRGGDGASTGVRDVNASK
jgi:hypothetical protein